MTGEQVAGPFNGVDGVGTSNPSGTSRDSGLGSMYGPSIANGPQPGTDAYYEQHAQKRAERRRQVLADALRVVEEVEP
jgi:hypothetical protein